MDILKSLYGLVGGPKYHAISSIIVALLFAFGGVVFWHYIAEQYKKDHPEPPSPQSSSTEKAEQRGPETTKQKTARLAPNQQSAPITVRDSKGFAVDGVQIIFVSPNGTHTRVGLTDSAGTVLLEKPVSRLVDVYCAHSEFPAYYKSGHDPETPLQITLSNDQEWDH